MRMWTREEVDSMIKGYSKGMSYETLAERHNRSVGSIKNKLDAMNVPRRKTLPKRGKQWMPWEDERLQKYWSMPLTKQEMAEKLKVTPTQIDIRAKALELPKRKPVRPKKRPAKTELTPWPKDMPRFEDHPDAVRQTKRKPRRPLGLTGFS